MTLLRRPAVQLALLFVAAAAALAVLTSRIRDWVVMTDELQYAKLATAFAHGDVLPTLRGVRVSAYAQLYPVLISPFYGLLSAPSAFYGAHVLNAVLMTSAAIPVYLLAREVSLPPRWSLVAGLLSIAVPWTVLSAFVMTESVAYPMFVWALLAIQRALAQPSPRRDALAVAAVGLAVLARTQFLVLLVAFALAAVLLDGRRVLARHRVLAGVCAAGLLSVAVLGTRVLGSYGVTATQGSVLSWKVLEQAAPHLDVVAVGLGLVPLLLGGTWIVEAVRRRDVFALFALVVLVAIAFETSSYDVRFGGGLAGIRERYVFYVVPLLLIAMLRLLHARTIPRLALAAVTAFVSITVLAHGFPRVDGLYVDAPVAVLDHGIQAAGGRAFVSLAAVVLSLALVRVPPRFLAAVAVGLTLAGSLGAAALAWGRLLEAHGPSGRLVAHAPEFTYDWIDRSVPSGAEVALLPYPVDPGWARSALLWWDVEFWNRTTAGSYVVNGEWDYAPFPHHDLRVDPQTGRVSGAQNAPGYVVEAASESRARLAGTRVANNFGLEVLQVERPWRVLWTTSGLDADGWTRPNRRAAVHVFAPRGQKVRVDVQLTKPDGRSSVSQTDACVPLVGSASTSIPNEAAGVAAPLPLGPGRETGLRDVGRRVSGIAVVVLGPCS